MDERDAVVAAFKDAIGDMFQALVAQMVQIEGGNAYIDAGPTTVEEALAVYGENVRRLRKAKDMALSLLPVSRECGPQKG